MFPEKGKDRRWMQNMDGTEKSTQNCSFIDSWITSPSRESEFQEAVPRDLCSFRAPHTGLEHHPVWTLLPWGSCPCLSHGLDRGAYRNQDLICVWSDLGCEAGTRRYKRKGETMRETWTGLLNNKHIWSSHSFNTYSLCTYCVPGAFLGDSSEQDRKIPAFKDITIGQPTNQVNRTTSIYIKHIKSGIAHQYILIDKLGPTLCYIPCSLVKHH